MRSLAAVSRAVRRRAVPSVGALALLVIFMGASLWVVPDLHHSGWAYTGDGWNHLQLAHFLDIGIYQVIYGQGVLTTTPGIVVMLAPLSAIIHAAGFPIVFMVYVRHPTAWLLFGPYEVVLAVPALFATDAVALRLGASTIRRLLICSAAVLVLYNVLWWGHPEDAVAVAFLLYSCLAASDRRWAKAGWLFGAAIAFQPFVLLALIPVLFPAGLRWLPGLLARAFAPAAALLVLPLALNWSVTSLALLKQPAFPGGGRPTPFLRFAPVISHDAFGLPIVAGGGIRLIGVVLAVLIGLWFVRSKRDLRALIAVVALTSTFRCVFDVAIAPYYIWPSIAFALVGVSVARWPRPAVVLVLVAAVDWMSNFDRHSVWVWWPIVAGLAAIVVVSWPRRMPLPPEPSELGVRGSLSESGEPDSGGVRVGVSPARVDG